MQLASSPAAVAPSPWLVVDLDGTLTRSDLLYETFWSAVSRRWSNLVPIARALMSGRASLKRALARMSAVDVRSLPYNDEVIAYVRRWRDAGGRAALVSASDLTLVEAVAAHVGGFDEVYGSDGATNLKGPLKAEFLVERFGPQGFHYIGDAEADLPVWQAAQRAVTVDAAPALRARVDALGPGTEHLGAPGGRVLPLLAALRPHQWLKNLLVFLPVLAAHRFDLLALGQAVLAFAAFSLTASSVYLVNDLLDLSSDRGHRSKRLRPMAAGTLPLAVATFLAPALLLTGLLISATLSWEFVLVMLGYAVVTTAYSLDLKRRLIIDICTLAGLYTLRIIAGGVATGIALSVWLLAFSIFFFFALAAIKRQAELVGGAASGETTARGRSYHIDDLPFVANMAVSSGYVSVLVMALYVNSDTVLDLYPTPAALWGICLVLLYWISRMVMITHRGWMHDDPVVFAARDRISLLCAFMILVFAAAGIAL